MGGNVMKVLDQENRVTEFPATRTASQGGELEILADIYEPLSHLAVWNRTLSPVLNRACQGILESGKSVQIVMAVTPERALEELNKELAKFDGGTALSEDINQLVDMFCCLFDQSRVGLRLTSLDSAMCPRFHVDKVPCRLVTTYAGVATQWLEHKDVDRTKLGAGNQGLDDDVCGLYQSTSDIKQLERGNVALLKGERWHDNEGGGLVHRSPALAVNQKRLILTLDFMN